jgi:hypothetical protein
MATYIVLGQFTDQGIRNVADTSKRADAAKELAKKVGAKVIISGRLGVTTWSSSWRRPTTRPWRCSGLAPARMTNVRTGDLAGVHPTRDQSASKARRIALSD